MIAIYQLWFLDLKNIIGYYNRIDFFFDILWVDTRFPLCQISNQLCSGCSFKILGLLGVLLCTYSPSIQKLRLDDYKLKIRLSYIKSAYLKWTAAAPTQWSSYVLTSAINLKFLIDRLLLHNQDYLGLENLLF